MKLILLAYKAVAELIVRYHYVNEVFLDDHRIDFPNVLHIFSICNFPPGQA